MSYTPLTHVATGDLATAALQNTLLDNVDLVHAGGLAIPSGAALDFLYSSSATQLARLAAGAAYTYPRINAAGSAWEFVRHEFVPFTASAAVSITIPGLDLNTDLQYDFRIETTKSAANQTLAAQTNADATNNQAYYSEYKRSSGISATAFLNAGATQWELSATDPWKSFAGTLRLYLNADGQPAADWAFTGRENAGGDGCAALTGSGVRIVTTNVTSMKFFLSGGTCDWRVFVRKV
jgi:hypothetical protein